MVGIKQGDNVEVVNSTGRCDPTLSIDSSYGLASGLTDRKVVNAVKKERKEKTRQDKKRKITREKGKRSR
jgi:hypothetical protein